ncbi:MAG: DUF1963 domain-containing protein [Bradyrhizobium sp.]
MKKIPPFKLDPVPLNEAARELPGFKWAPKDVGKRHQLGGEPQFIQQENWPKCPSGHGLMTFYAQLDSINDELSLADCGMIYVFICYDCFSAVSVVQSC